METCERRSGSKTRAGWSLVGKSFLNHTCPLNRSLLPAETQKVLCVCTFGLCLLPFWAAHVWPPPSLLMQIFKGLTHVPPPLGTFPTPPSHYSLPAFLGYFCFKPLLTKALFGTGNRSLLLAGSLGSSSIFNLTFPSQPSNHVRAGSHCFTLTVLTGPAWHSVFNDSG